MSKSLTGLSAGVSSFVAGYFMRREADKNDVFGSCLFVMGYASLLVCEFDFTEPIK